MEYKLILVAVLAAALFGQNSGLTRTVVERGDVSVPGREAVIVNVVIAPGATTGRHHHPGEEISYIMEGEGELLVEGKPLRKLKTGDGMIVPAGAKHEARNTGSGPLKVSAVYLVEKGKPLATPAP